MIKQKACGCIIINDHDQVLLVYENNYNFWGFPKGHVEDGETEIETALREVKEETGLDVEIDESKRFEMYYTIRKEIEKTNVFYLAKPVSTTIQLQEEEIQMIKWCTFEETIELLTFDVWKDLFKEVLKTICN